jgi:hypothetical protein
MLLFTSFMGQLCIRIQHFSKELDVINFNIMPSSLVTLLFIASYTPSSLNFNAVFLNEF